MGDNGDLVFAFLLPLLTTSRHLVFFNLGLFPPSPDAKLKPPRRPDIINWHDFPRQQPPPYYPAPHSRIVL